jgi:hypothetical protein
MEHEVSMNDERFEQPWQPLKGISIKNKYAPELSYPTNTKDINLKGLPNKTILRSKIDHFSVTRYKMFSP